MNLAGCNPVAFGFGGSIPPSPTKNKMLIYKIGEIVKPFDRTLEGQYAVIKNRESRVSSSGWDSPRYLIEFNDGEQYIISGAGLSGSGFSKEVILPDDLFEI